MLEHWKTLGEGCKNLLDDLLCKGGSLDKYNMFSQLKKIESTTWFKWVSLTEKFMICLINKCSFILYSLTQSKFSQLH